MSLSDAACKAAKPRAKPYKTSDGGGLYLYISPNGSKLWRLAYRFARKPKTLSIGAYPTISLAEAREHRDRAKKLLATNVDPMQAKKAAKLELQKERLCFKKVADDYLALQKHNRRAPATIAKLTWLLDMASADLGDRPIEDIHPRDVLAVLRRVEGRGRHDTARRLRSTIGSVFRLAVASGDAETDPTAPLKGTLASPPPKHRAAITDPKAFGGLLRAIEGFDGQPTTRSGLLLLALLFPRPGELRAAEWPEFDLEGGIWTIPATRTKMRRPHRMPLSRQALRLLIDLSEITGRGRLVLPSVRRAIAPLSENTFNAALRRLGYGTEEATAHGFRATASTLLNESNMWHPDAIERQLAHVDSDAVRRAYARGIIGRNAST